MLALTKKYRFVNKTLDKTYKIINILQLTRVGDDIFVILYQHRNTLEEYVFTYTKTAFNTNIETLTEYTVVYSLVPADLKPKQNTSDFSKLNKEEGAYIVAFIFKDGTLVDRKRVTEPINWDEYHE